MEELNNQKKTNKALYIIIPLILISVIVGIVYRNKFYELFQSFGTKKSTEPCPEDEEKNNFTYFTEKLSVLVAELADPEKIQEDQSLVIFGNFVSLKLYNPSEYDKKINEYSSSIENENKTNVKKLMEKSYDSIMKELGPPTCILTQTQLTTCTEVLDDLKQKLN